VSASESIRAHPPAPPSIPSFPYFLYFLSTPLPFSNFKYQILPSLLLRLDPAHILCWWFD
jgi:hypothetical protein